MNDKIEELKEKVIDFQQILEIKDSNGENMIIDWVSPASVMNYKLN